MRMISAKQFQKCFGVWMKSCHGAKNGEMTAIDGKTLRSTYDKGRRQGAMHMVSAFSTAKQVILVQVKISYKFDEITAIPELLELLNIRGCLVCLDAMGCQSDIAKKIVQKEADYLLAIKGNPKKLESAFNDFFRLEMLQTYDGDKYSTQEKGHGRTETRLSLVNYDLSILGDIELDWPELTTMGIVASIRQEGDEAVDSLLY